VLGGLAKVALDLVVELLTDEPPVLVDVVDGVFGNCSEPAAMVTDNNI
jgi:hypothetical protein